jgi:hypothetical protein
LFSDPAIVAAQADGVLLVVDDEEQQTLKEPVRHAVHSLRTGGGKVLGTVTNNVDMRPLPEQEVPVSRQEPRQGRLAALKRLPVPLEFMLELRVCLALVFGVVRPFVVEPF